MEQGIGRGDRSSASSSRPERALASAATKQLAELDGARCSSTPSTHARQRRRWTASSSCSATKPTPIRARSTSAAPRSVVARTGHDGQSASLRAGRRGARPAPTRSWSRSATSPSCTPRGRSRACSTARGDAAVRATYDGRPGHPVVLERGLLDSSASCGATRRARCSRPPAGTGWRRAPLRRRRRRHPRAARGGAAMKLEQSFEVEGARSTQVWEALIDLERVAPCLPGADDHRARRGRHLPRHVPGQARPDHRRLPRHDEDRGALDEATHTATMSATAPTSAGRAARTRRSSTR